MVRHASLSQWLSSSFASSVELRYLWVGLRTTINIDGKPQEVLVKDCADEGDPQDVASLVERVSFGHTTWIVNWDTKATICLEPPPEVRVIFFSHRASRTELSF